MTVEGDQKQELQKGFVSAQNNQRPVVKTAPLARVVLNTGGGYLAWVRKFRCLGVLWGGCGGAIPLALGRTVKSERITGRRRRGRRPWDVPQKLKLKLSNE